MLLVCIYMPVAPIILFLLSGWLGSLVLANEDVIYVAAPGFLLGCAISAALYKLIMAVGYKQKTWVMVAIYLFYTAGLLGFFMGVPVFIVVIGFFAALYTCNKASIEKLSKAATMALVKRVALFCTAILAAVCMISAYVALADPYTGANIQRMFALNFEVNAGVIWVIIVIGGTCLLALQYAVVYFFGKWFRW